VEEIQQALIREGFLKGPATGTWDEATRDAMRRYQSNNGFSPTGLPDAKSLMKLGLGPHPLPEDVKPAAAAQASVDPSNPN
jgi:peptidoglycan hydrolase-like protein with peptidoglycan-binding domain